MKLKLGSQQDSSPPIKEEDALDDGETGSNSTTSCNEAVNIEACKSQASFPKDSHELANATKEDLMTVDSDYSTTSTTSSTPEASEDCQSKEYSPQRRMKNSIFYLFSKFKNSTVTSTIMEEAMTTEDNLCCMVMSPSSSASRSTDNIELHSEQESVSSSTV